MRSRRTVPMAAVTELSGSAPTYDAGFFAEQKRGSVKSAEVVVPVIVKLLPKIESALDVGCGIGAWLRALRDRNVADLTGVDGPWVPEGSLLIEGNQFCARDLTQPIELSRRFDLVICLEVAEHLPATVADRLVGSLCAHGDVVLFSAAIPGQGGTGHINEQWPEYWVGRFRREGMAVFDVLRPRFWNDQRVDVVYRQNMFLFIRETRQDLVSLNAIGGSADWRSEPLVHPELWAMARHRRPMGPRELLRALPSSLLQALRRRGLLPTRDAGIGDADAALSER